MTASAKAGPELPVIPFADQQAFADWLAHPLDAPGVWLQLAKKGSGIPSITYEQAVDVALCYGWIDSQKKGYDETWWIQKFTPRRPNSKWSRVNREKAERFIAEGRMQPGGLREVERAQENGQWDVAYDSQSAATVPDDLQAALDANPAAADFFATLNSVNRYAILHRIQTAKKPETRRKRIQQYVDMLARGERIYPQ